jgi:hypothetical protein
MAEGDEEILEGMEVIELRVEFDLIPDWSNTLERIAQGHAARTKLLVQSDALVVKIAIAPEKREAFFADVQRYWEMFAEWRRRQGRWTRK